MAESAPTPTTPAAETQTPAEPVVETLPAEMPTAEPDSPFPDEVLARRPDLAAKYGNKGKAKGTESKAAPEGKDSEDEGTGGSTKQAKPEEPAKQPAEPAESKFDRQIAELARHAEDPEVAKAVLSELLRSKSAAGAVAAAARKFKKARQVETQAHRAAEEARAVRDQFTAAFDAFKANPKEFAKKNGHDFRAWLAEQVADENQSPETKRIRELEAKQAEQDRKASELEAWRAEVGEREKQLSAAEADRGAITRLEGYLSSEAEQQAYPHVFAAFETKDLAQGVWNRVKAHYVETGIELDWRALLRHEDDRLRQIHERLSRVKRTDQPASNGAGLSERAGAVKSAKPGGKGEEPNSLSNADASERVSEARPPKNREEHLDNILRRHGLA